MRSPHGCRGALIALLLALLATAARCAPGKGVVKPDTSAAKHDRAAHLSARDQAWSHGSGKVQQSAWLKKLGMEHWAAYQDDARASFAATQATYNTKTQALAAATTADVRAQANIAELEKSMAAAAHANQLERAAGLRTQLRAAQDSSDKLVASRKTATTERAAAETRFLTEQRQLASLEITVSALELHAARARLLITEVRLRLAHMNAKQSKSATEFLDALTWQTQESTLKTEKTELMARYSLSDPALTLQTMASSKRAIGSTSTDAYEIEFQKLHDVLWAYVGTSAKGHRLKKERNRQYWLAYFGLQTESQELDKLAAQAINAERDLMAKEKKKVAKETEFLAASNKLTDLRERADIAGSKNQYKQATVLADKVEKEGKVLDDLREELNRAKEQFRASTTAHTLYANGLAKYEEILEVLERVCARFTRDALSATKALSDTAQKEAHDTKSWALAAKLEAASKASNTLIQKLLKDYVFANTMGDNALPDAAARSGAAVRNSEL